MIRSDNYDLTNVPDVNMTNRPLKDKKSCSEKYVKWNSSLKDEYIGSFTYDIMYQLNDSLDNLTDVNQILIDELCSRINNIFVAVGTKIGMVKEYRPRASVNINKPSKPWFNIACKQKRLKYFKTKHKACKTPNLVTASNYKRVCK